MPSSSPNPRSNLYGYGQAVTSNLYPVIVANRDPTTADLGARLGQVWVNKVSGSTFMLGKVAGGVATWNSTSGSITVPLTVANGGTGATTLLNHGVLIGQGTSAVGAAVVGLTGQVLIGATGADPVFGALGVNSGLTNRGVVIAQNNAAFVATTAGLAGQPFLSGGAGSNPAYGTLGVAYGGTNVDASAAANGTLLIGNGTGYTLATLTAGSNITITNGAGSISIASSGGGSAPGSTCNFQAYLNADATNVTGDGTTVTIPFDNTRWNVGSGISGPNFTVPAGATGKYQMTVNLALGDVDAAFNRILLQLVASSNTYTLIDQRMGTALPVGLTNVVLSASVFADFLVASTSTAYLALTVSGGTKTLDIVGGITGTLWSGFYIGT